MSRVETIAEGVTLYLGDCREILPTLGNIDVAITDPPYSEETHKGARGRGASSGGKHILVDFESITDRDFVHIMRLIVEATNRWVVSTCYYRHGVVSEMAGLPVVRLGVWTKVDPAPQFSGDRPATGWEMVIILHRAGKKRWNGGGKPATWRTKIVKTDGLHPSQKPIELISDFVSLFSDTGEMVLDPFMGAGTTGVAAVNAGRQFIGIEIEPKYFDIACRRIDAATKQTDLFVDKPRPAEQIEWAEMWTKPFDKPELLSEKPETK